MNSRFNVVAGQLRCLGSDTGTGSQVIADQVEDFQVRYGTVTTSALGPQFRDQDASAIGARWADVSMVHVCLQIAGDLRRASTARTEQRDCQGRVMQPDGRTRRVVRASFHLRNSGQS